MAKPSVSTLIDVDLWNKAEWNATAFLTFPNDQIPGLALVFRDRDAGRKIFTDWIGKFGSADINENIRVAIIEGPIPGQGNGYTVHIGPESELASNPAADDAPLPTDFENIEILVSRLHRMNPQPGSPFLPKFKDAYDAIGQYYFLPAIGDPLKGTVDVQTDLMICKKKITFKNVSDIGVHDPDRPVLPKTN